MGDQNCSQNKMSQLLKDKQKHKYHHENGNFTIVDDILANQLTFYFNFYQEKDFVSVFIKQLKGFFFALFSFSIKINEYHSTISF